MQINYVKVVLAVRHVQPRIKKGAIDCWLEAEEGGESHEGGRLAQVLGTYSITGPQSCTGSIISGF